MSKVSCLEKKKSTQVSPKEQDYKTVQIIVSHSKLGETTNKSACYLQPQEVSLAKESIGRALLSLEICLQIFLHSHSLPPALSGLPSSPCPAPSVSLSLFCFFWALQAASLLPCDPGSYSRHLNSLHCQGSSLVAAWTASGSRQNHHCVATGP